MATLVNQVEEFQFQVEEEPHNYAEFIVQRVYFEPNYLQFLFNTFSNSNVPGLDLNPQDIRAYVQELVPCLELPTPEGSVHSGKEWETESLTYSSTSSFYTVLEGKIQNLSSL